MKIDLQRAVEVLSACGYECEELYATHNSFQAGAASRDDEIAENNANYSALAHLAANYLGERNQLREQVATLMGVLKDVRTADDLGYCRSGKYFTETIDEALAATEPK